MFTNILFLVFSLLLAIVVSASPIKKVRGKFWFFVIAVILTIIALLVLQEKLQQPELKRSMKFIYWTEVICWTIIGLKGGLYRLYRMTRFFCSFIKLVMSSSKAIHEFVQLDKNVVGMHAVLIQNNRTFYWALSSSLCIQKRAFDITAIIDLYGKEMAIPKNFTPQIVNSGEIKLKSFSFDIKLKGFSETILSPQ